MAETPHIDVGGRKHAVIMPDFAAREELLVAYGGARDRGGVALLRVYAAAIGLCTRLGREAGADYGAHRYDVLAYGGAVYGWLRQGGASVKLIAELGGPLIVSVSESLYPRQSEVDAAAGNSGAGEAPLIG